MTPYRKQTIQRLRAEGKTAFQNGKSIFSNPYKNMDMGHWQQGWRDGELEFKEREREDEELGKNGITTLEGVGVGLAVSLNIDPASVVNVEVSRTETPHFAPTETSERQIFGSYPQTFITFTTHKQGMERIERYLLQRTKTIVSVSGH